LAALTNAFTNVWTYLYATAAGCCGNGSASVTTTDPLSRQVVENRSDFGLPIQTIFISGTNKTTNSITYVSGMVNPDQEAEDYAQNVTDEGGRTRTYSYTELGQLQTATDLGGNTWTNQYDLASGALTNVLSPTGETLAYTYDGLDNLRTIRYGDGFYRTNNYSTGTNLLASVKLPSGTTVTFLYDSAGRLTNRNSAVDGTTLFYYNANDVVTGMTNAAGITTNYFDSAGRLTGMDYPTGANVRYGLDVLGRITSITNKTSSGGTAYVTKYQYDAVGNLTNVVDPWNGQTSFTYDQVNRKKTRTLPNSVVTTYDYDWRDRVTNIVHKIGSTVLASVGYIRAIGGEPTRITREDGTYVILSYDGALRLTNEVYYSSGGSPVATNSYGYDASGTRVLLVTGGATYTNAVGAGYRVTQVKDASSGAVVETYGYDNGGRITSITRSGQSLTLGFNTSDQATNITVGTTTNIYVYDAAGRRVKATQNGSTERRFLVAPTPETDLESPQLIADSANNFKQGYVFVGDEPLLRHDGSFGSSRVYYLEDGIGSVIGLTPHGSPSINNTTRLFYSGFGALRGTNGPAPSVPTGTGGDFRFHGLWWESATDFLHARARDYDARTGRFLSRDPLDGERDMVETLHPYSFANCNPFVYSDPSGLFTVIEINVAQAIQFTLQTLRVVATSEVKSQAINKFALLAFRQLDALIPGFDIDKIDDYLRKAPNWLAGNAFDSAFQVAACAVLQSFGVGDKYHFRMRVTQQGNIVGAGRNCNGVNPRPLHKIPRRGYRSPDFIIGDKLITPVIGGLSQHHLTHIVGDVKASSGTLFNSYVVPGRQRGQLAAILNYAGRHTDLRIAAFVVGKHNLTGVRTPEHYLLKRYLGFNAIARGVFPVIVYFRK